MLKDETDQKEYKNKYKFFQKRAKVHVSKPSFTIIKMKVVTSFHKQNNSLKRKDI